MSVLEGGGPLTFSDAWLFTATAAAVIFIMMIIAGLPG